MDIGNLRHRVKIESYTPARDSYGAEIENWISVATVWASVEPISGKEYFASKQINAEVTTTITMRYHVGISPAMRVIFKERIFEILSVINLEERNIALVLMCKEAVPHG